MKKPIILSVLFILLIINNCFSQLILIGNDYLFPIKDSVKIYKYECNSEAYYRGYAFKGDSLIYNGLMGSCLKTGTDLYIVDLDRIYYFISKSDVNLGLGRDTLKASDIINMLRRDSIYYQPKRESETYNNKPLFDYEYSIDVFKKKNKVYADFETLNSIFSKFYKTESIYKVHKEKVDLLKKNKIPLWLISTRLSLNVIGNPEVTVQVKNISDYDIDAYDINIYCYNRYGNPVKKYSTGSNMTIGTSQSILNKGEESSDTWVLYGQELTTNVKVFLTKVHFTNGKTFILPNKQLTKIEGKL